MATARRNRARAVPLGLAAREAQRRGLLAMIVLLFALASLALYGGVVAHHRHGPLPHPRLLLSGGVVHVALPKAAG